MNLKTFLTPTKKSAGIFFVSSFFLGFGRYLFHLVLLHFLRPPEYGEFLAYLSLLYLLSIPTNTLANLVTKYVAELDAKNDHQSMNSLFRHLLKTSIWPSFLLGIFVVGFSNQLAVLFKAHPVAFIVLALNIPLSLITATLKSYLGALRRFAFLSLVGFIELVATIFLAILLIKANFSATGAVAGQILATIIGAGICLYYLWPFIKRGSQTFKKPVLKLRNFLGFSFLYTASTSALISLDVLAVRVRLDEHISGIYSSLSIMGRMIYFGLTPLITVALPTISHRFHSGKPVFKLFLKFLLSTASLGFLGLTVFHLLPEFITRLFSGSAYLEAAPFLSKFSLSLTLLALNTLIVTYFIAIEKPKMVTVLALAALLQPVLIYFFSVDLASVISIDLLLQVVTLLTSLFYISFTESEPL